jgi:hypothetical protein
MPTFRRPPAAPDGEPVELAALADGSLAPERRAALAAEVAGSPELEARLAEQERVHGLIRTASLAVEAPAGLRARVEAERRPRRARRGPRLAFGGVALAAAVATALALLFTLPGGAGGPSIAAAAELSLGAATGPAPPPKAGQPKLLARSVDGVPFPSWEDKFGWRTSGERSDRLSGRRTGTVFYTKQGHRLGYTIVGGAPLRVPKDAERVVREGTELHTFVSHGRLVVTWQRNGRTCVLVGPGVDRKVLLKLASWKGKGAVPF